MKYRREIDGLRGLAVSFVILSHAGISIFAGGYIGVDIFFVISGYLIFSIIKQELNEGTFTLARFYERRARRILPVLFVVVLTTIPVSWFFLMPKELEDFGKSLIFITFFMSNFLFWRESGYFEAAAELKPLLHTWSLSVEEQFYILFPIFMVLIWRFKKSFLIPSITAVFIVSLATAEWASFHKPWPNFYLLPTRGWEILTGVIGALISQKFSDYKEKKSNELNMACEFFAAAGLILIFLSLIVFNTDTRHPSFLTLIPILGTMLVLIFTDKANSFVTRLLSNSALTFVGLISYSLYLWHQPVFAFAKNLNVFELSTLPIFLPLIFTLSWASFILVETPFRNRKIISIKAFNAYLLVAMVLVPIAGVFLVVNEGFSSRLSESQIEILKLQEYPHVKFYDKGNCLLIDTYEGNSSSASCESDTETDKNTIILWGDSFAAHLYPALRDNDDFSTQLFSTSCPPLFGYGRGESMVCVTAELQLVSHLQNHQPKTIVLAANWLKHEKLLKRLESTLKKIKSLTPTSKIILFGNLPQWHPTLPQSLARAHLKLDETDYLRVPKLEKLKEIDKKLKATAEFVGIEFILPIKHLCKKTACLFKVENSASNELLAFDYGHLTIEGGKKVLRVTKLVEKILVE